MSREFSNYRFYRRTVLSQVSFRKWEAIGGIPLKPIREGIGWNGGYFSRHLSARAEKWFSRRGRDNTEPPRSRKINGPIYEARPPVRLIKSQLCRYIFLGYSANDPRRERTPLAGTAERPEDSITIFKHSSVDRGKQCFLFLLKFLG